MDLGGHFTKTLVGGPSKILLERRLANAFRQTFYAWHVVSHRKPFGQMGQFQFTVEDANGKRDSGFVRCQVGETESAATLSKSFMSVIRRSIFKQVRRRELAPSLCSAA